MNLHQFRFIQEAVKHDFNLTEVAQALFTSQPGISMAIKEFEQEIGFEVFHRKGRRLVGLTKAGEGILSHIRTILCEVGNLKRFADNFKHALIGTLSIATTHTQARYFLPRPITQFRKQFPDVQIALHQGTPEQVAQMLLNEDAEVGLATEALSAYADLISLPCYEWQHVIILPSNHPLAAKKTLSIEDLSTQSLVTYQSAFTGRKKIDLAFAQHGYTPNIALEALDSDVIKTYVQLGMGIGIIAEMAVQDLEQSHPSSEGLLVYPAQHLFGINLARIAFKKGVFVRKYLLDFVSLLNPNLNNALLESIMTNQPNSFDI